MVVVGVHNVFLPYVLSPKITKCAKVELLDFLSCYTRRISRSLPKLKVDQYC